MRGVLVLEDGTVWNGKAVGAQHPAVGEVVFNTSMTGYDELLADPSYAGHIVVMTYPLVGNYGVTNADLESNKPAPFGVVVRELCDDPSNWRARGTIADYLREAGVAVLEGVDTRALTHHLRQRGAMRGCLAAGPDLDVAELHQRAIRAPALSEQDLVRRVTAAEPYTVGEGPVRIAVLDLGCKRDFSASLARRGARVTVFPATTSAAEVLASDPHGIVLSGGPGDPAASPYVVDTVKELVGKRPIFGICLGHQMLALALGAKTYKLKHGHRGVNHPVKDLETGRVYITSQNHGYAVDRDSLAGTDLEVSHVHVNDGTVEGLRHRYLPVSSVQYHPEGSPGPNDSCYLLDRFMAQLLEA